MLTRMATRGMLSTVTVWDKQSVADASGVTKARQKVSIGTFQAYKALGNGTATVAQEGTRSEDVSTLYFSITALLDESAAKTRWLTIGTSPTIWRISNYHPVGNLYALAVIHEGGGVDGAGHIR